MPQCADADEEASATTGDVAMAVDTSSSDTKPRDTMAGAARLVMTGIVCLDATQTCLMSFSLSASASSTFLMNWSVSF